jgi:hypothetical protein
MIFSLRGAPIGLFFIHFDRPKFFRFFEIKRESAFKLKTIQVTSWRTANEVSLKGQSEVYRRGLGRSYVVQTNGTRKMWSYGGKIRGGS